MKSFKSAEDYCADTVGSFEKKANHNKLESQACFWLVIVPSVAAPLFIAFGDGLLLAKIVPSMLSVAAASATTWLQLRKPQQLWALYRTAQRRLEIELLDFRFGAGAYASDVSRDGVLLDRVNKLALEVHDRWLALVPNPDQLSKRVGAPSGNV
ncbi:MAG: DUF4231 domain-containing protein [Hyphomicrobium sp.]